MKNVSFRHFREFDSYNIAMDFGISSIKIDVFVGQT